MRETSDSPATALRCDACGGEYWTMVRFSAVENGTRAATPFLVKLANALDLSRHST
jgi:hypothetical protein